MRVVLALARYKINFNFDCQFAIYMGLASTPGRLATGAAAPCGACLPARWPCQRCLAVRVPPVSSSRFCKHGTLIMHA